MYPAINSKIRIPSDQKSTATVCPFLLASSGAKYSHVPHSEKLLELSMFKKSPGALLVFYILGFLNSFHFKRQCPLRIDFKTGVVVQINVSIFGQSVVWAANTWQIKTTGQGNFTVNVNLICFTPIDKWLAIKRIQKQQTIGWLLASSVSTFNLSRICPISWWGCLYVLFEWENMKELTWNQFALRNWNPLF